MSYTYHQYTLICTILVYSGLHFSDDFMSSQFYHSVQSLSHIQFFVTPWTAAYQASLSITNSWSLLKLMSIESVKPSNCLILCHPLLLLPSIFHRIRVFSNESALCIRWPKYWSFSFGLSPSSEYSGLVFFRIDGFDLIVVQGTPNSLVQPQSSKASILQLWAFLMVQLSYLYVTTGKTIALIVWTFVNTITFSIISFQSQPHPQCSLGFFSLGLASASQPEDLCTCFPLLLDALLAHFQWLLHLIIQASARILSFPGSQFTWAVLLRWSPPGPRK